MSSANSLSQEYSCTDPNRTGVMARHGADALLNIDALYDEPTQLTIMADVWFGCETMQKHAGMNLTIHQLTPDRWPALEDLFGKGGASNGRWCMYWRIGSAYHKRPREENRHAFCEIVADGPPPGLLAYDGERAVGWRQLTPRADLLWLARARFFEKVDDLPVWAISCFYVRRGCRRQV